jgi:hypothetical protein
LRIDSNNIQREENVVQLTTQASINLFVPLLTTEMATIPHVTQVKEDNSGMPQAMERSNDPNIPQRSNRNVPIELGSLPSVHEINSWRLIFGEAATSMNLFFVIRNATKQQHGFLSNAPKKKVSRCLCSTLFIQH